MSNKGVDATAAVSTLGKRKFEASTSSSTADPVEAGGVYDVFLSFCGEDTRKGFTNCLYEALVDAGIQTFIDNEDLETGEEIGDELLKAIKESKISIPIFSQKYASSKWCLLELQQMVKCYENQKREKNFSQYKILPIFYDVTPSDVRNQSGSYEMAFSQHEKNFSEDTVQKWRDALRVVGELKGLELTKETNGYQGKFIKLVVKKVLSDLKKNYTHLPEILVGMDNHIEELTRLLQVDSNDKRVVGILGMGGLGKTTIAKVIFNTFCNQFEGQCFLDDVREKSTHGMVDMQKQLISSILHKKETSVSDVNEGKKRINDASRGKKLLIVLDDVDDYDSQVKMLMGDLSRFGQQSCIILTTRNKTVLDVIKAICESENPRVVYSCYEPKLMDDHHALQLFSKYAFHQNSPLEGYESLSEKVARTAAGLPLVLRVLGSSLHLEYDTNLWEESLTELQKIPNEDVMKKLKFSFDALNKAQQQIFLDIACLFIGYSKTRASYMWADCGFSPIKGIRVLVSRSLVTVGDDDILMMHDQLRDLGRHIVNEEGSLKEKPGEQSRLWCPDLAMRVLEEHQGTSNIIALRLGPYGSLENSHFHDLSNLRYLCINEICKIDGDYEHLLPNLRWLEYRMIKFFPNNLLKETNKLKVLDLSYCIDLQTLPNLSNLTKLVELDLRECRKLTEIPGLQKLESLQVLNLPRCTSLETLPNISNLKELKVFDAWGCKKFIRIEGLHKLLSLTKLDLSKCLNLTEIPGLQKLESLQVLNINGCTSLETLPNISNLTKLKVFDASYCFKLIRIEGLHKLLSLTNLDLRFCDSLKEGVGDLSNLNKLEVLVGARGLDTTDFSNFKKLKRLQIYRNNRTEIQNLDGLEALEDLLIYECPCFERLPNLTYLKRLKNLRITECEQLTEIRDLGELKSLEFICIERCSSLKLIEIESRARLDSLKYLIIQDCMSLERLADLPNFGMLQELEVVNCDKLQEVIFERIEITGCVEFQKFEIPGLEELKSLESLNISGCSSIVAIPNISNLQKLKRLDVSGCEKLSEIPGLEELKSLESLNISRCSSIVAIPNLSNLQKLKHLFVYGCVRLSKIHGLEELKSLRWWR